MSPRSSEDASVGFYRKPGADLYTIMLIVALLALIVGTVFLYLESSAYGPTPRGEPSIQTGLLMDRNMGQVANLPCTWPTCDLLRTRPSSDWLRSG